MIWDGCRGWGCGRVANLPYPTVPAEARRLIEAAFPDLPIASIRHFGEGWANVVWIVNEESEPLLFRFPKAAAATARTLKEMRLLPELAAIVPAPVPDYHYAASRGVPGFPYPFGGYPLLPGRPLAGLEKVASPALASAVGRFISALQAFPSRRAAALGVPGGTAEDWRCEYDGWYRETRPMVAEHLNPSVLAAVDRKVAAFLDDDRHFRFQPALLHRDLGPEHLLVDPATGKLTGVIDFEDATVGDPAFDFTGVVRLLPGALDAYAGARDATFLDRILFYQFVVPIHELRYGLEIGVAEHVERGRADLLTGLRAAENH